jgi:cell division protein ZipA
MAELMELSIRDWMVIIGVLLIAAVLLDAWRRVRSDRYSRVRVKLVDPEEAGDDRDTDLAWLKELPNGGARVVERGDLLRAAGRAREDGAEAVQQSGVESAEPPAVEDVAAAAPGGLEPGRVSEPPPEPEHEEVELITGITGADTGDEPENLDWLEGMGANDDVPPEPVGRPAKKPGPGRLPRSVDPEVFMLNVVAREPQGFRGEDILQILLACDLRFGDMNFFHRHEFEAGRGAIQFSVANMVQPGVFDLDKMTEMNTPGLVFFVTLPGPEDMMKAFDYMLETAQAVARNLGGDVLDESRSVLTRQTLEHCRQQIRDLERRLLTKAR